MSNDNLQDDLSWMLIRASMFAKQKLLKVSEEHDLTMMQALTLCLLEPDNTVPMFTISDLLTCDPSNVTGIVERLSNGNYIERRESSADRRVKTITLTPTGIKLRRELFQSLKDNDKSIMAQLSDEQILTLKSLLMAILPAPEHSKQLETSQK